MTINQLIEKAGSFELSDGYLQSIESGRQAFLQKFPREKLADLTLEEYAIGNGEDSFCYWLEQKKIDGNLIGPDIRGFNNTKFCIFSYTDGHFYTGYKVSLRKPLSDDESQKLFSKLKGEIVDTLNLVDRGEIDRIKKIKKNLWNMVMQKILFLYYPDKFLSIVNKDILEELAYELNLQNLEISDNNVSEVNYQCRKALAEIPQFSSWNSAALGKLIMDNQDIKPKTPKKQNPSSIRYWIYSPGQNAENWDEYYQEGIMAINWDEIGDLRQYNSREEIKNALINKYGGDGNKANDVSANDDFLNKMKPGDIVFVKKGRTKLLGYGEVVSEYEFQDQRKEAKSIRKINWKERGEWSTEVSMVVKTLTDVSTHDKQRGDYEWTYQRLLADMGVGLENYEINPEPDAPKYSLNTIFYGPPGTGKTYHTVRRAAEIIVGRTITSQKEASEIYSDNLHDRIEFITFHQNYSYEDFIQGLRPETDNQNSLSFHKRDGIFKKMADKAMHNLEQSQRDEAGLEKEAAFEVALAEFKEMVEDNDGRFVLTPSVSLVSVEEDAFRYTGDNWPNVSRMKYDDLREFFRQQVAIRKDIRHLQHISGLARHHATYFFNVYEQVKARINPGKTKIQKVERKNYVLIIDEINRANISRVFGELITLIETDKRKGQPMEMKLRLPSGDLFSVPDNLYLIGTMNTADKSISLLDIALRHRFDFEPMYPLYEIHDEIIPHADVLRKINNAIIERKGHDFQIGHAYFMSKDKLETKLNQRVIPLLMEYFMNDDKQVKEILNGAGLKVNESVWPLQVSES